MDSIKQWALSLCVAAIALGIMYTVTPRGNLEKLFHLAASAFFVCCLLSPVMLDRSLLQFNASESDFKTQVHVQRMEDTLKNQTGVIFKDKVEQLVNARLEELKISPYATRVFININGDDSIFITGVRITLSQTHEPIEAQVKSDIQALCGVEPEVVYHVVQTQPAPADGG